MNRNFTFISFCVLLFGCATTQTTPDQYEVEGLRIVPLGDGIFAHVSYLYARGFGKVACNGMIYMDKNEAIVFDTPTDDVISEKLIHWIEKIQKKRIKAVVATHFHEDCLGGLKAFHENGTASYANEATIAIAKERGVKEIPQNGFQEELDLQIGKQSVISKFIGEGHTRDNVVGYIPSTQTLFGGCLVKSVNAPEGYLGDANTAQWSETVQTIKNEYPDLNIVIPGHGRIGSTELLDYTIELFDKY